MRHSKLAVWLLSASFVASFGAAFAQEKQPAVEATTSGAATASATEEPVSPGPLLEARKMLWMRINLAKSEGIGTSTYITAFKHMDEEVKAGKSAEELRPRIESLARSLKDQLDRAKILKTQRPIPPTASQSGGSGEMPMGGGGPMAMGGKGGGLAGVAAALGGGGDDALLDKLKAQLMGGGGGDLEALKQRALKTKKGREFLEKLGL
jgi:hypothetical protein